MMSRVRSNAEDTMLTVSQATMLLLYSRARSAGGSDEHDTLSRSAGELRLLAGAALIDLVFLERVRVRPVSPTTRRLLATVPVLLFWLLAALLFVSPSTVALSRLPVLAGLSPASALTLGFILIFGLVAVATWALGRLFGDQVTLLDLTPTGDSVLDEALARGIQKGAHVPLHAYLRALRVLSLAKLMQAAIGQLEQQGFLTRPTGGPTLFGLLDRRHVARERPEFVAIGTHLRRLVLDRTEAEPQAAALLLLFAWTGRGLSFGGPAAGGVYQFFAPQEYPQLRAVLRSFRRGDATVGSQLAPGLYKTLRAIAVGVHQARSENSTGG
jgi:hypothetical protein